MINAIEQNIKELLLNNNRPILQLSGYGEEDLFEVKVQFLLDGSYIQAYLFLGNTEYYIHSTTLYEYMKDKDSFHINVKANILQRIKELRNYLSLIYTKIQESSGFLSVTELDKCNHESDGLMYTSAPAKSKCKKCNEYF